MNLDPRRLEGARNFANKIWQAARFILMNLDEGPVAELSDLDSEAFVLEDRWILSRLNQLIEQVTRLIESFQYGEAGRQIRDFLWDEFCDWYIEATKVRLYDDDADKRTPRAILITVLEQALRLLHPYMPFVTEAIWQAFPAEAKVGDALIVAPWPEPNERWVDEVAVERMGTVMDVIREIRAVRAEYNVQAGRRIAITLAAGPWVPVFEERQPMIAFLARLDEEAYTVVRSCEPLEQSASVTVGDVVAYLPLAGMVDLEAERARLSKNLDSLHERIEESEERLAGPFAEKAPEHIVQRERDKLASMRTEAEQVKEQMDLLSQP